MLGKLHFSINLGAMIVDCWRMQPSTFMREPYYEVAEKVVILLACLMKLRLHTPFMLKLLVSSFQCFISLI